MMKGRCASIIVTSWRVRSFPRALENFYIASLIIFKRQLSGETGLKWGDVFTETPLYLCACMMREKGKGP